MFVRTMSLLAAALLLAGCFQASPQLKTYQADRDAMMATGNRDQR